MPLPRRLLALVVAGLLVAVLGACQVEVAVDTRVNEDGSGTVDVGVGLDDKALARAGALDKTVRVDDMVATGWVFAPVTKGKNGFTWLRASKRFDNAADAGKIMAELTAPPGGFKDFVLRKDESIGRTTWTFTGTVDLSKGIDTIAEPALATVLNGDSFGGRVPEIEQAEGKKVADMVDITVGVSLPDGSPQAFKPKLGDQVPTQVNVVSERTSALALPLGGAGSGGLGWVVLLALIGGAVVALAVLRRRFRTVGR